jgi:uncharacterized protein YdeI (YjbR/CyaY-like superfamily)
MADAAAFADKSSSLGPCRTAKRSMWLCATVHRWPKEERKRECLAAKVTPRTKKSIWSKVNRQKALALIKNSRMKSAGLKKIERAKKDGRWDAAGRRRQVIFRRRWMEMRQAKAFFASLDARNRFRRPLQNSDRQKG